MVVVGGRGRKLGESLPHHACTYKAATAMAGRQWQMALFLFSLLPALLSITSHDMHLFSWQTWPPGLQTSPDRHGSDMTPAALVVASWNLAGKGWPSGEGVEKT